MIHELSFDQLPQAVMFMANKLEKIEKALEEQGNQQPQTPPAEDELMTVPQAAEFLNMAVPSIYSKVSRGELPAMKRGKRLYFSKFDLWEYLKAGRKNSNSDAAAAADAYIKEKGGPDA